MNNWTSEDAKEFLGIIRNEAAKVFRDLSSQTSSICACLAIVTDIDESGNIYVRLLNSPDDGSQDFAVRNRSSSTLEVGDSVWLHYWGDYTNAYIAVRNMGDNSNVQLHADTHAAGASDFVSPTSIGAEKERLVFSDQTVSTASWTTYTATGDEETLIQNDGYIYKKTLSLSGVLASMDAFITPSKDKKNCGAIINDVVITYDGGIQVYAKSVPTSAFTLRRINCFKAVG